MLCHNLGTSAKYESDSNPMLHVQQAKDELSSSSVNPEEGPPPLPVRRQKPNPDSWKQTNEQDIKMYESVCCVTTNSGTSTKHESDSNPMLRVQQTEDESSSSSSVNAQEDLPPLPVRRQRAMKPKPISTQNEQVRYMMANSGTNIKYESDSSPVLYVLNQQTENELSGSRVNWQEDSPPPPVHGQHRGEGASPHKCQ